MDVRGVARDSHEYTEEFVKADEDAYSMGLDTNSVHDTPLLRYGYNSMTTQETTNELTVATGEPRQQTQQPVLGSDASQNATENTWATARHGHAQTSHSVSARH